MIDFVCQMSERTELPEQKFVNWLQLGTSKYFDWKLRYGRANEHNARIPRDHWLTEDETRSIVSYAQTHPQEGYRRLTYMMMDADVAAVSPATTYRVLKKAGLIGRWNRRPSQKGTGFHQPANPHDHWHIDIAHLNIVGTFYYLMTVLDGASRFVVHWDIRESMTERDVELILQRAKELFPEARPRIISDNGPQFIAKDFKEFVRLLGMTHVRTSPFYPQSNGKLERYHRTIKGEAIRPMCPLSLEEARRITGNFVEEYNNVRLHSSLGYVTPRTRLDGRQKDVHDARDAKLDEARRRRARLRAVARSPSPTLQCVAQQDSG